MKSEFTVNNCVYVYISAHTQAHKICMNIIWKCTNTHKCWFCSMARFSSCNLHRYCVILPSLTCECSLYQEMCNWMWSDDISTETLIAFKKNERFHISQLQSFQQRRCGCLTKKNVDGLRADALYWLTASERSSKFLKIWRTFSPDPCCFQQRSSLINICSTPVQQVIYILWS